MAKIVPNNPFTLPPSMEVSEVKMTHMYRKYGIRVTSTAMDSR
jgi:hypothetical protein